MYNLVLFDFFGVFCASIATNWFKKTITDYPAKLADFQALCTESDLGKLSRVDFNAEVSRLTGVSIPKIAQGIETETIIDTTLVQYVEKLKSEQWRVACLSNGSHEWTLQVIRNHGLEHLFEDIILSGDLGIVKPDPEIYLHTLKRLSVTPSQTIFVDDRKANVEAAETLGIRSLLFTTTPNFIKDFETLTREHR